MIKQIIAGIIASSFIALLVIVSLIQLWFIGGDISFNKSVIAILQFSFSQSVISAGLSLGLGIFLGRAYVRRSHIKFLRYLSWLFNASFLLPVLVAVFGLISVHGINGWVNGAIGTEARYIYGWTGIIIAHVFFNVPLAARLIANGLQAIPLQHWKLFQQLGLLSASPWKRFWVIEYPHIKPVLFTAFALIFLLCFTSFAIVLTLGGGLVSTLEVAIYQALRLQFEPAQAAFLGSLQILICLGLAGIVLALGKQKFKSVSQVLPEHNFKRPDADLLGAKITDTIAFIIASLLILPVLVSLPLALLADSALKIFATTSFAKALLTSLSLAPLSALLSVLCAIALATAYRAVRLKQKPWAVMFELPSFLLLIMPPVTLSAGLFLLLYRFGFGGDFYFSVGIVIVINALLVLPFTLPILSPPLYRIAVENNRLAAGLGLKGFKRWWLVELPLLRKPLGLALGLSAALAVGDVSAIALFGTQDFSNLPLLLYRLLGSYRFAEAGCVGLSLCGVVFLLFWAGVQAGNAVGKRRQYVRS